MAAASALSPIHIGLLFLLLLGANPLRRGKGGGGELAFFFRGSLDGDNRAELVGLLLTWATAFLLSMSRAPATARPGTCSCGALLASGCCELLAASRGLRRPPAWSKQLESPQPACRCRLLDRRQCGPRSDSPDRCLSVAKAAAALLAPAGLAQEWGSSRPCSPLAASCCCCCPTWLWC